MTIFAIPRAHTFAPQIKFNKHSSYSLFFNCSKCSYWLLLKIFIFILESASGCLGIYCFISIIPCVVRILPFQTILLPLRYCSPARRRALTHTCTDNLSQYQAPQNHRSSNIAQILLKISVTESLQNMYHYTSYESSVFFPWNFLYPHSHFCPGARIEHVVRGVTLSL